MAAVTTSMSLGAAGVQHWLRDDIWLRGSVGRYRLSVRDPGERSGAARGIGWGTSFGVGYTFCTDCAVAAEVQLLAGAAHSTRATPEQGFSADAAFVQTGFGILWY